MVDSGIKNRGIIGKIDFLKTKIQYLTLQRMNKYIVQHLNDLTAQKNTILKNVFGIVSFSK